jgi:hypothetical protein
MGIYWDCGRCGNQIEHRWMEDRLVFACNNSKEPHFVEQRIITLVRHRSEMWALVIPAAEIVSIIVMLT